jgi:homoserine kinase type II
MAVYTKISDEDLKNHLKNYEIGELTHFQGIVAGIDNSNFLLKAKKEGKEEKYILTIFESRINEKDLPFFINLKDHLAKKNINCPKPIANKMGSLISDLKGKKSIIVTFLSGSMLEPKENGAYDNITKKHCFSLGKNLAKMHLAANDFEGSKKNELSALNLKDFFKKFSNLLGDEDLKLEISEKINFIEKNWSKSKSLKTSAIHADLFPDNVFFNENQEVSGIIDFYFAEIDLLIFDLAVIINAWCFDENNKFSEVKFLSIIDGYEEIRKLTIEEKSFLKIALIAAAMRFSLTRLHDKIHTLKDSLVKVKDPNEFLERLRFFYSYNPKL